MACTSDVPSPAEGRMIQGESPGRRGRQANCGGPLDCSRPPAFLVSQANIVADACVAHWKRLVSASTGMLAIRLEGSTLVAGPLTCLWAASDLRSASTVGDKPVRRQLANRLGRVRSHGELPADQFRHRFITVMPGLIPSSTLQLDPIRIAFLSDHANPVFAVRILECVVARDIEPCDQCGIWGYCLLILASS